MYPEIDHILVWVAKGGPEGDLLVEAGLVEGSGNVHPGQGTANRRFFFADGFMLELAWVEDEEEARSEATAIVVVPPFPRPRHEPTAHRLPLTELGSVRLRGPGLGALSHPARFLAETGVARFDESTEHVLELGFGDPPGQERLDLRPALPLSLTW